MMLSYLYFNDVVIFLFSIQSGLSFNFPLHYLIRISYKMLFLNILLHYNLIVSILTIQRHVVFIIILFFHLIVI